MAIVMPDGGQSSTALNGKSTDFLMNKIILDMPTAPDALVASKLSDTLRDFYTNAGAWRELIGPYRISPGRDTVFVNPVDQYSQFQYVLEAFIFPSITGGNQRQPLRPITRKILGNDVGLPLWYWMENPTTMRLYPVPDTAHVTGQVLWLYGILQPLINTTRLPDISITHHQDALCWGTLARLHMMPQKPWTDKGAAQEYAKMYKREVLRWRDVANRSYSNATPRWQYPSFAGRNTNHGTSQWGARG